MSNASAGTLGKLFGLDPMSIVITERGDEEVALSLVPNDDGKFDVVHGKTYRVDGEERQPVDLPSVVEKSPSMVGPFGSYSRGPFTPARSSGRGLFQEISRTPYSRPSAASFAGDSSSKPLSKGRQKTPLMRNIVVVKLDGGEMGGGRTYAIKGYLKVKVDAPAPISLSGITAVVERTAEKQGVRGDLLLLDKWGYPFPDDMVGQDWEPPLLKILAAPRENYEQHFGSSSLSLGDKLLHTPEKPKAAKRAAGKTRSNPRKRHHAHVAGSSADGRR